jgi:pseudouridine kinase
MRIVCIGSAHVDLRLALAGPPVAGTSNPATATRRIGGVAANVARNAAALGAQVVIVAVVGADPDGDRVLAGLAAAGVDVAAVERSAAGATGTYAAVLDPAGDLVIGAAATPLADLAAAGFADRAAAACGNADAVVLDANLPAAVLQRVASGIPPGALLAADPVSIPKAPRLAGVLERTGLLVGGLEEAGALLGRRIGDAGEAAAALVAAGAGAAVVTRGAEGVVAADRSGVTRMPAIPAGSVKDVTGAGDALLAATVVGIASGRPLREALRRGLAAAALTVAVEGPVDPGLSPERVAAAAGEAPR